MDEFNPSEADENLFADAAEYEERQDAAAGADAENYVPRKWDDLSEREQLLVMISDMGKDAMGIRPRWHHDETLEELRATLERYSNEVREQVEQEEREAKHEAAVIARAFTHEPWKIGDVWDDVLGCVLPYAQP